MTKDEFITERTRIISEMLDNPDEYDIYPTTKCFKALDDLFDKIVAQQNLRDELIKFVIYREGNCWKPEEKVDEYLNQRK